MNRDFQHFSLSKDSAVWKLMSFIYKPNGVTREAVYLVGRLLEGEKIAKRWRYNLFFLLPMISDLTEFDLIFLIWYSISKIELIQKYSFFFISLNRNRGGFMKFSSPLAKPPNKFEYRRDNDNNKVSNYTKASITTFFHPNDFCFLFRLSKNGQISYSDWFSFVILLKENLIRCPYIFMRLILKIQASPVMSRNKTSHHLTFLSGD